MKKKRTFWQQAAAELKTVRDFVRWGASAFSRAALYYGHGTDNAWDEALALVLHALSLDPEFADKIADANLTQSERQEVLALFKKRTEKRIPERSMACSIPAVSSRRRKMRSVVSSCSAFP